MVRRPKPVEVEDELEDYNTHVRTRQHKNPNFFDMDEVSDKSSNNSGSLPRNTSLIVNHNDNNLNSSLALNSRPGLGMRTPSSNSGFRASSGSLNNSGSAIHNTMTTPSRINDRFSSNSNQNLSKNSNLIQKTSSTVNSTLTQNI